MIRSTPKAGACRTTWAKALCLVIGAMLTGAAAHAQSSTATLSGIVVDANDAVVAGATVTVVSIGKKLRREVTTDREGLFVVPLLPPDRYSATIQRQGFAIVEIKDLILNVSDQRSIRIHLRVGQISESVTVESPSNMQTESAVVSTLIDRQFANELPLNGRTFDALLRLVPGTALSVAQSYEPGQFSINGQRPNANYYMVDGVGANVGIAPGTFLEQTGAGTTPPVSALGGTNSLVPVDALQEFRVQTSSYAPEFGRTPGGQVSIITRSGTHEFHGTAFEYLRNEALDANDWFANAMRLGKPPLRQNDFGGVLGGPILRNRTFFFFSYEGLRLRLPQVAITTVPSLSLRQNAAASVQPLLKAFPIPNGQDFGNGLAECNAGFSNPSSVDATSIRIDHLVSRNFSLFGRYNYSPSSFSTRGFPSLSDAAHGSYGTTTLTLGATQVFGPKMSNDLRVNYSRVRAGVSYDADDFGGAVAPTAASLFPSFVDSSNAQYTLTLLNFAAQWTSGPLATNFQRQLNIVDNLATVEGAHSLQFGADYRRLSPISGVQEYNVSVLVNTMSEVLAGRATRAMVTANKGRVYPLFTNFSAYAQDTWQAKRRLTVTYGLRWDLNPPPSESHGDAPFTVRGLDNPATMTLAPQGTPFFETTYGNFAPRVGLAYQLSESPGREMVMRGGFGIFYDLGTGTTSTAFYGASFPHSSSKVVVSPPFPLTSDILTPRPFTTDPPYQTLFVSDPHLKLPRTYEWNVALEGSLGKHQSVSASYVGAAGRELLRQEYLVNPNRNFTDLFVTRNAAESDYQALQIQFNRRLSRGLQALGSYTWSHSIDTVSLESSLNVLSAGIDPSRDRGSSDFDIRHTFSAAATYDIPKLHRNRLFGSIVNSWVVDGILRINSAPPVNPIVGGRSLFGKFGSTRPDLVPNVPLYVDDPTVAGGRRINRAAFNFPPDGQQGTLGRNALRGFSVSQVDVALARQFRLMERWKLQLRAEAFNVFNHPNFAGLVTRINFPTFGLSTSMLNKSLGFDAGLNPLYQIGGPRSIQLALKLQL